MMDGLAGQGLLAVGCLAGVLLLILAGGRLAKSVPGLRPTPANGPITLQATLALDRTRRLHLVQACGTTALILTGGATDLLIPLPPAPT